MTTYGSFSEIKASNATFVDLVSNPATVKSAADLSSKFTRTRLREEGFMRRILEPIEVSDSDLVPQVDTDQPVIVMDMEQDVPMAVSVGFGDLPNDFYIMPKRYRVTGTMIQSPRIVKLEQELRTYRYDVRQLFADNIVKDLQYEEDRAFISGIDSLLLGANTNMYGLSVPQWVSLSGGWTRENVVRGLTTLQKTPWSLVPETCLANTVTLMEFVKWRRDEAGGDISQQTFKDGYANLNAFNVKWLGTIKRYLVGDNTFYQFAAPKFMGIAVLFQPPTMWIDPKYHRYAFHADEFIGANVAHSGSVARVDVTA